jgi:hypothetical protein
MSSRNHDQPELEFLAVVALLKDLPEHGLVRGQVGTVVEPLAPDAAEVEFIDDQGQTYALVTLRAEQVMRLHHRPSELVA